MKRNKIYDYQKYFNHYVLIHFKNGTVKRRYILDIDFGDDNDDGKNRLIYFVRYGIGRDGNKVIGADGIIIDDIKTIEYDD